LVLILLKKLAARRVDLIVGDRYQLLYLADQLGAGNDVRIIGKPLAEVPRFVGFRKEGEENAVRFEKGLEIIRQNGTLSRVLARCDRQ
jgi:polar amino acid transport system substrate-binding protein